VDDKELTRAIKNQTLRTCEKCGNDRFYEGPSGGASTNFICTKCRARYNVSPFGYQFVGIDPSPDEQTNRRLELERHKRNRQMHYYNKGSNYYLEGKMLISVVMEVIDYKKDNEANLFCHLEELRRYMVAGFIDTMLVDLQPTFHRGQHSHGKKGEGKEDQGSSDAEQGASGSGHRNPRGQRY